MNVDTRLSMAVPYRCSYIDLLLWKYVYRNTRFKRYRIWTGVAVVQSARSASRSSFHNSTCSALSIGTLVNSDYTSKDIIIPWIFWLAMVDAKFSLWSSSSLTMNKKFQYHTRRPRAGIEIFEFIVSERVQANPENSRAMSALTNWIHYKKNSRQTLSQAKLWCNDSGVLNLHH